MAPRRLTREEWAYEIQRALKLREAQQRRMRRAKFSFYERYLSKALPLALLIGFGAVILLIKLYGWTEFFKFFLAWIVNLTLVATAAYYLWKSYEREL